MGNYSSSIIVKNKLVFGLLTVFILMTVSSCNAVFEKNISEDTLTVILPTDQDTVYSNKVHFKWVEMDGASFYNLQIVRPSFDDIEVFELDSNITGAEFYHILEPGDYAVKIRGENGGHTSSYSGPYHFYVDSVLDLSDQFVSLISPSDEVYIDGSSDVAISWQNLYAADQYEFILKIGDSFETGSILDQNLNITTNSYTIPAANFSVEGIYHWGIKGSNLTSASDYSSRKIFVDLTAPNTPTLISPTDEVILSLADPVILKWTTGTDPGTVNSPVTSTVEISTSESFIDFTEYSGITVDSLSHTFAVAGDYWWRVKTVDGVGNVSEAYSETRKITME